MARTYTFPHTNITTNASINRTPSVAVSTATTLLAPFACDKGPTNQLVAIDSMSEFINTYGELDYSKPDQRQILNIGAWLSAGGRVMACRIVDTTCNRAEYTKEIYTEDANDTNKETFKVVEIKATAKYAGSYYNGITIVFTKISGTDMFNVEVYADSEKKTLLEKTRNVTIKKLPSLARTSSYIDEIQVLEYTCKFKIKDMIITDNNNNNVTTLSTNMTSPSYTMNSSSGKISYSPKAEGVPTWNFDVTDTAGTTTTNITTEIIDKTTSQDVSDLNWLSTSIDLTLAGGKSFDTNDALNNVTGNSSVLYTQLKTILAQPLDTPFDCMIDCGYSKNVKNELVTLFNTGDSESIVVDGVNETVTSRRDDAFLYLTNYYVENTGRLKSDMTIISDSFMYNDRWNISIIDQFHKVVDLYSLNADSCEVYVPTTYFLAGLIPYWDAQDGCQFPLAGLTRGVIKNSLYINMVPTNKEKQEHFEKHLNYIESDSTGKYIMTQMTCEQKNTDLNRISKARALLKIKKELTLAARKYLHEFNDRITRKNLESTLNSYLNNWINNRTLSTGSIEIYDYTDNDTLTNEELLINVNIKFTKSIEIISFEINI